MRANLAAVAAAPAAPAEPARDERAAGNTAQSSAAPASLAQPAAAAAVRDELAIGYVRAFVTLLVLAHHAVLAYIPYPLPPLHSLLTQPRWWQAFPVLDTARSPLVGVFVGWNDIYFMSLMFFVSGLFLWSSVRSRGSAPFLRRRAMRLGVPFVVAAAVVAPLAYYPAYVMTGAHGGIAGYAREWLALGNWPAGPAWFLWVLLAFDTLAALATRLAPRWGDAVGRLAAAAGRRPILFFALLAALSAAAYLPLALTVGPAAWSSFGPFTFQTSRIAHYAVYFLAGIAVGAAGLGREGGLLAAGGRLARRWGLWLTAAFVTYAISAAVFLTALAPKAPPLPWPLLLALSFVLCCACSCFALLAIFLRFTRRPSRAGDSLRANAYGMYVIHYAFASWLQLALLAAPLGGLTKATLAVLGTVALSWSAVAALRRLPTVARFI